MKARLEIDHAVALSGKACAIVPRSNQRAVTDQTGPFLLYTLDDQGLADQLAAHGQEPHRLSEYAFGVGARSIRHDYDLRAWADSQLH